MQLLWTRSLPAPPAGLSLARETGTLLVRDQEQHLARFDRTGQIELRQRSPASLLAAVISDDGQTVAAVGKRGQVWLLTLDFVPIWERAVPRRPMALAVDIEGRRVAIGDESGELHVFDRSGRKVWHVSVARPLVHLAFVAESPALVGSAEYGLVSAFAHDGRCLWRDGLVAHVGSLAVTGDGSRVVLACFTEGLNCYGVTQSKRTQLARAAPSRLVAIDYRGQVLLTTGMANELALRGTEGDIRGVLLLPANPVSLALEALGREAVAILADDTIAGIQIGRS